MAGRIEQIELDQDPVWEIQFDETLTQYRAFCLYRDLLDGRSIAKVAARWGKQEDPDIGKAKPMSRLQLWSSRNRWVERAEAYDLYLERKIREERETEIGRMQRMEGQLGRTMVGLALNRIVGVPQRGDSAEVAALDANQLTAGEVAQLAKAGVEISRISTARPTSLVKGAYMISPAEFSTAFEDVTEILFRHIPDERKPLAAEELRAYTTGERRMIGA